MSIIWLSCVFILSSCASDAERTVIFDESLHDSDMAIINWFVGLDITEYNGISVDWKVPLLFELVIKIPGGNTCFILNGAYYSVSYTNMPFIYYFEKGKEYWVRFSELYITISDRDSIMERDVIARFYMTKNGQERRK
jgi:hypothetical protein